MVLERDASVKMKAFVFIVQEIALLVPITNVFHREKAALSLKI